MAIDKFFKPPSLGGFGRLAICLASCALAVLLIAAPVHAARQAALAEAPPCTAAKMGAILEQATPGRKRVIVDCSFILRPGEVVTKALVIAGARASGVRIACQGGRIGNDERTYGVQSSIIVKSNQIRTRDGVGWEPPRNVTVEDCEVFGSIIVFGMGRNSRVEALQRSSRNADHTINARLAAPSDITFRRLTLRPAGGIALFLSPGVTRVRLVASDVLGHSKSTGIYLAAETAYIELRNNRIMVKAAREQIAVDGSAHNVIDGNWFAELSSGGIYLYRNCGEDGMIRHQPPQHNTISNNVFFYRHYRGGNPAVWLASRNGNRSYCDRDKGHSFGSSISDKDFARQNEVVANRIVARPPEEVIRIDDKPNRVARNTFVSGKDAEDLSRSGRFGRSRRR